MRCLNVFKVYRLSSKYTLKKLFVCFFLIYIVLKINLKQKTEILPKADKLLK